MCRNKYIKYLKVGKFCCGANNVGHQSSFVYMSVLVAILLKQRTSTVCRMKFDNSYLNAKYNEICSNDTRDVQKLIG
jgi:hypothetical protein